MMDSGNDVWKFDFCIEARDGSSVSRELAADLLERIHEWVEQKGLQIGGGYYVPSADDPRPFPVLPEKPRPCTNPPTLHHSQNNTKTRNDQKKESPKNKPQDE